MKAVILAGGFGTRLRPLTFSKPKPLIPLLNRPVLAHILDHLKAHGVDEVAITTNYLRQQIMDYFGREYCNIRLTYPSEDWPMGTAGCVKNIEDYFDDTFIVMQGDTITDMDLSALVKQHNYYSGLCTIGSVRVKDPWNYGVMDLDDMGRVRQFFEKPLIDECTTDLVNTGVYVMEPEALEHVPANTFFDFSKNLFPILLERQSLFATLIEGFWIDVGRPGGYNAAKKWMMSRLQSSISPDSNVEGKLEGPVVIGEGVNVGAHTHIIGPVVLGDNAMLDRKTVVGPYTVIGNAAEIGEYSLLNGAVLFENVALSSSNEVANSIVAENCRVGVDSRIQSDVLIGSNCYLKDGVSIVFGSRLWPNMEISGHSLVNGTLKRFVTVNARHEDPEWVLRKVTSEEAFYFNKKEGSHVSYTGQRARSLLEFNNILKEVEASSLNYHLRSDVNDFQQWLDDILCDPILARDFEGIKQEVSVDDRMLVRQMMIEATTRRLNQLLNEVRPRGYA
ncbi:MAG: NTP transferase domain-containing protein [Candidatus Altiarchaeales archaeon]|nr:NTP transferase domain-containing protein [Candidatus Altiarchaeales archaeon]MBD3417225.1 NTP transferase domain-containing protein [Candidatus Altiarchaeales archaeon]